MRPQEILYNVTGQSWFYDCPEGRPDASPTPTLSIVLNMSGDNVATVESATTGAVALDAVNTTLSQAVGAGAVSISVASATGIAKKRRYLLTDTTTGLFEWFEVVAIVGTTVRGRRPLVNSYASGATLVGCRITIGVDPTWVANQAKISDILATTWRTDKENTHEWGPGYAGYRLRWSYSVNGSPTVSASYGDLVRYTAKNLVTPPIVDDRFPGWIDRLPVDHLEDQGQRLIDEAYFSVRVDAMADNQTLRRIRNTEILRELVVYRAPVIVAETNVLASASAENVAALAEAKKIYQQRYDQLLREPKFQYDPLGDGSAGGATRLPVWRR
jgi:hypothetical protein